MNESVESMPESPRIPPVAPSRRDRLKPLELLGFSGVIALFVGLVILGVSRSLTLGLVFAVIVFIACVLMVALLGLGGKPSAEDLEARKDLKKPNSDFH